MTDGIHAHTVRQLAEAGVMPIDIAKYLNISKEELLSQYSRILNTALINKNILVAKAVYDLAIDGNLAACQFWLKNLGKWEQFADVPSEVEVEKVYDKIQIEILKTSECPEE